MKKYLPYVRKYWYYFLLGPFFMVLEACGEFVLPFLTKRIIDIGAANGDIPFILQNGGVMALIAFGMLVTGVCGAFFAVRGAAELAAGVRKDTFDKIQTFSFADIDRFTTGSLITRITNDITQIQNFAQTLLRGMFRSPVMLIGALVMSFAIEPRLAVIILCVVPVLALAIFGIIKAASPRYTAMQQALDSLNTDIRETATAERVIKSFVREEYETEKFDGVNEQLVKKSTSALKWMLLMHPASTIAMNITTLLVVWVAGRPIMLGEMPIGTLTAFITYLTQILTALTFVANIVLQGTRAAASDRRISEVLDCRVLLNDDNAARREAEITRGEIEFCDVSFLYYKHGREKILNHASVKIPAGHTVGIVGTTGSGKTTLISLIPRLYDADSGEVLIDGINVKDYSLPHLRERVSVVLQKNTLFAGSIAENLRWGNPDATDEELRHVAEIAAADEFIASFPDGFDTELGQGGVNLSGGQKQRLCIARALLKKPKILILDDSTSAVDTATDARIRAAFRTELRDMTTLVIAQRIQSIIDADEILVMDKGAVVGFGKHEELLKTSEIYRAIYESQVEQEVTHHA